MGMANHNRVFHSSHLSLRGLTLFSQKQRSSRLRALSKTMGALMVSNYEGVVSSMTGTSETTWKLKIEWKEPKRDK